jgi:hypothetical protein
LPDLVDETRYLEGQIGMVRTRTRTRTRRRRRRRRRRKNFGYFYLAEMYYNFIYEVWEFVSIPIVTRLIYIYY